MKSFLPLLKLLHTPLVLSRRVRVLSGILSAMIPDGASVLDIGCGSGSIGKAIMHSKPTVSVRGVDVLVRPDCLIETITFDGRTIPLPDATVDVSLLIDVLHHTDNIPGVLGEACRVSCRDVIIKDHLCENLWDFKILKFMDWVGNRQYGVALTYNYWNQMQWKMCFASKGLMIVTWFDELPLYPVPFQGLFGRGMHFIAHLRKR